MPPEEPQDQAQEPVQEQIQDQAAQDRSFENLKAENERKAREIQELRDKVNRSVQGYNPNDITTWDDSQLKALAASPATSPQWREQAQDILVDRRIERRLVAEREREKRESFEVRRLEEFPETFDRANPLSARMEKIVREMALDRTPAGYYAAAKIAASEMRTVKNIPSKSVEAARVEGIRQAKSSPDRAPAPGSTQAQPSNYDQILKKVIKNESPFVQNKDDSAFLAALKAKAGGSGLKIPSAGL